MASPFKVFRQYQRELLAFLAVLAILAFVVGDPLMKMAQGIAGHSKGQVLFRSNVGDLTQANLLELRNRRNIANHFMFQALVAAHPELEKFPMFFQSPRFRFRFGQPTSDSLVLSWLLRHEAQRMGIVVDDLQIERFLDQETNKKLTTSNFRDILEKLTIAPRELYGILRDELAAMLAYQLTVPSVAPSPEQYWRFYQQLNTRQKIEAAVLPISDFKARVPAPSEAEIARFFEAHKGAVESSRNGEYRPGFRQPPRVRLQYLVATYKSAEEWVTKNDPVTDRAIEEYYETKKDLDMRLQERGPAAENPAHDAAPLDPQIAPEEKSPAARQSEQPAGEKSCGGEEEAAGDESPKDQPAADDEADASADEPATPDTKASKPAGKAPAEIRYKPLDDELRDMIRESLLRERTLRRQRELQAKAAETLPDVGARLADQETPDTKADPQQRKQLMEISRKELQSIAKRFDMRFGETQLVSGDELRETPGIGRVEEPDGGADFGSFGGRSILERAFESETLRSPMQGEDPETGDLYVYWKVEDVPAHVPTLGEPKVKEKVIDAWKHQQALPLAKKRAEELAELVRKSLQPMEQVLAGQTVSGEAQSAAIAVRESPEFSWWKESFAPTEGLRRPQVQLGNPVVVPAIGLRFMQFVFDELKEKETGSTINDNASAYVVVRVASRKPADREAFKEAPLFNPSSAYEVLAQRARDQANIDYSRRLEESYALKSERNADDQPLPDEGE
ncbi:MAG: hypothetical protein ACT4QC_14080 [Planctomycetaceae bacterium]